MKASDITEGGRYLLAEIIPAGPRTPRIRARRAVTVIAKARTTVTVEALERVCANHEEIPPEQIPHAMVTGRLRWELQPVRREVRAADILGPYTDTGAGQGELEKRSTVVSLSKGGPA